MKRLLLKITVPLYLISSLGAEVFYTPQIRHLSGAEPAEKAKPKGESHLSKAVTRVETLQERGDADVVYLPRPEVDNETD